MRVRLLLGFEYNGLMSDYLILDEKKCCYYDIRQYHRACGINMFRWLFRKLNVSHVKVPLKQFLLE